MAAQDIPRFVASIDQVALRVFYDRLPGLLRKRLDVPEGTVALLRRADKSVRLVPGGVSESDFVDGVLLKKAPVGLDTGATGLLSEDGLDVGVKLRLELQPRPTDVDLGQLERELVGSREVLLRADVEAFFAPFVREALRFYSQVVESIAALVAGRLAGLRQQYPSARAAMSEGYRPSR